jgi:hypothetical protein
MLSAALKPILPTAFAHQSHTHNSSRYTMQLEDMVGFCSDVDLNFPDGTLPARMAHLGAISSVLRGAIDAHNSNSSSRLQISMDDISKEQWMQVARFLYPVAEAAEAAEAQSWEEAALLLRVGAQFDMPLLLQATDRYIVQNT